MSHTPGPWSFKRTSSRAEVCMLFSNTTDLGLINKVADTRLIAATPDLLGALITLHDLGIEVEPLVFANGTTETAVKFAAAIRSAHAAIAKATGDRS